MKPKNQLDVMIISPAATLFNDKAEAVSALNHVGKFDILPQHANFISLLINEVTVHRADEKPQKYSFKKAVVHCKENKVYIFVGLADAAYPGNKSPG